MFFRRRTDNRGLTSSTVSLTSGQEHKRTAAISVLALVVLGVFAAGFIYIQGYLEPPPELAPLQNENRQLREALSKAQFEVEVERATRNELERQVGNLNEQLKQVSEELAFMKSAGGRRSGR
jgi:hypothetical protein